MTHQQPGQGFNVPPQPQQPQQAYGQPPAQNPQGGWQGQPGQPGQPGYGQPQGQPSVQQVHNPYGVPQQPGPQQAPQQPYGQQPQSFGAPPQQGAIPGQPNPGAPGAHSYSHGQHQQQGPSQVYGAGPNVPGPQAVPGYDPQRAREVEELENQALIWLIVGGGGFFFGFGWITGPLAWIFGARLKKQFQEMGEDSGTATAAWVVGIVSTLIYLAAIFFVVFIVMAAVGAAAAGV